MSGSRMWLPAALHAAPTLLAFLSCMFACLSVCLRVFLLMCVCVVYVFMFLFHLLFLVTLLLPLWWNKDEYIIFLPCGFFLLPSSFFTSPNLNRRRLAVCHTSIHSGVALRCRSETCCTRLADNTGHKNSPKNRHLGTVEQVCRAISSQLRHISTIGKKTC